MCISEYVNSIINKSQQQKIFIIYNCVFKLKFKKKHTQRKRERDELVYVLAFNILKVLLLMFYNLTKKINK